MSVYDKRRAYRLFSNGRNYILSSEYVKQEKLLFHVTNSQLYLNKIGVDEWNSLLSSKTYTIITESYGCLGLLSQKETSKREHYLLFVKDATSIGQVKDSEILRVSDVYFIHLNNNGHDLNRSPNDDILDNTALNSNNSNFVDIRKFLSNGYFYFSLSFELRTKFDLTLNSQQRNECSSTSSASSDTRYFWNLNLHTPFKRLSVNTDVWLLKVICGCVEVKSVFVLVRPFKACLISRLSCERAGTRFNCRGLNDLGSVANFVETEQILFNSDDNQESSFTQIRGSLPLFWEQAGFQVGAHKIRLTRAPELCYPAFVNHFKHISNYDKCFILNLLSKKGDEYLLSKYYEELTKAYMLKENKINDYLHFDYHAELKSLKSQALIGSLWPQIEKWFANFKATTHYFKGTSTIKYQNQVVRTNCMDCLDRTNSVQLFIALELLKNQLIDFGIYDDKSINKFRDVFRQLWIINGDNISKIYAGTGAIQGKSVTQDIGRSLTRAIQNNFLDSSKQDVIDLLLVNYNKKIYSKYGCEVMERAKVLLNSNCFKLPSYLLYELVTKYRAFTEELTCNVVIATWNINGGLSDKDMSELDLSDWLVRAPLIANNTGKGYLDRTFNFNERCIDIFAIGFEEIVDLNASNIVNASDENSNKWFKKLKDFFLKYDDYVPITCEPLQLVGVCLFVFAKKKHSSYIRDVCVSRFKTGLAGTSGNKGGVSLRFTYYNSSLCFVCSHFAAHQGQIKQRNDDYKQIYENTQFPLEHCLSRDIKSHDYVFWCGDLNYRIDMPNESVRQYIRDERWDQLVQADQLTLQRKVGNAFKEFLEADLCFPPTYKYNLNSDYYDTSEKCRIPAWTDRVLWRRSLINGNEDPGKCVYYGCSDIRLSDHRPVSAQLQVKINKVQANKLYECLHNLLQQKGPFQATVVVSTLNNIMSKELSTAIIDDFKAKLRFDSFTYREFKNKIYITYFSFNEANNACAEFNNYELRQFKGVTLRVELENDNFDELVAEELSKIVHKDHTHQFKQQANQEQSKQVKVGNLLGDDLFTDSLVKVPSQLHINLSYSNYEEVFGHNDQNSSLPIQKSFSQSDMLQDSYPSVSTTNGISSSNDSARPQFHLFDIPHDEFKKSLVLQSRAAPRRPPPPPPSASTQNTLKPTTASLIDIDNSPPPVSCSPPPPLVRMDSNSFIASFKKSNSQNSNEDLLESRSKENIHFVSNGPVKKTIIDNLSDLLILGDPGTPPPPPLSILQPTKVEQKLFKKPLSDLDLLGDPGNDLPPPPPPPSLL